ncbi:unnamed protein product [Lota lota]
MMVTALCGELPGAQRGSGGGGRRPLRTDGSPEARQSPGAFGMDRRRPRRHVTVTAPTAVFHVDSRPDDRRGPEKTAENPPRTIGKRPGVGLTAAWAEHGKWARGGFPNPGPTIPRWALFTKRPSWLRPEPKNGLPLGEQGKTSAGSVQWGGTNDNDRQRLRPEPAPRIQVRGATKQ